MNVKLSTKLGWKSRGPAKNLGGHGPSTPPLQPPLISVVQLFMTYGPFYKNVTTRGPLPMKWCIKQNRFTTFKTKRGKISECVIEIIAQYQTAIYYKSLSAGCLWSRLLWFSDTILPLSIPVLMVQVGDYGPVFRLTVDLFLNLTCFQPVAMGRHSGAMPLQSFLRPSNFVVSRKFFIKTYIENNNHAP